MQIDLTRWGQRTEPQREGREWCWAAALAAVCRYQVDTLITQEHFVLAMFGTLDTAQTPDWGTYSQLLGQLHMNGIEYHRQQSGTRKLEFNCIMRPNFDGALVMQCLQAGRPAITTIQGGAHDVVIVGVDITGNSITAVHYWNPSDNGIGHMTLDGFLGFNVICTVAVEVTPGIEQVAFISGGTL